MSGFVSALRFLTRVPLPEGQLRLESAVVWLPVVGLLLGAVLASTDYGLRWLGISSLLTSTLVVVLLLFLSGALHADGLMDTFDAVFGHATPERRLEIMRDPRAGAFGVVGLVCVVALKISAVDALPTTLRSAALMLAPTLGRWAIVLVATVFPYARPDGLGAPFKRAANPRRLAVASVLPVAGCIVSGPMGLLCGAMATLSALGLGRWFMRLLPGLTGDCFGAVCELVEAVVWLSAALAVSRAAV